MGSRDRVYVEGLGVRFLRFKHAGVSALLWGGRLTINGASVLQGLSVIRHDSRLSMSSSG